MPPPAKAVPRRTNGGIIKPAQRLLNAEFSMYHSYFGLREQVFSIAVDPHYLYMSSQHREALAHLLYGVKSGGFVLLTGEVGTGKTTIVRCLLEQLPEATDLAIVLNPVASAPELLGNICDEFGIEYDKGETSLKVLMDKLYQYLLHNHTRGRNTVLLIDEAQLLRIPTLEQIRLLTNLETNTRKLLQIILVGQPELNGLLAKPALRQLSQRITARYHLRALTLEETRAYINHRLHVGGMKPTEQPFSPAIVKAIHNSSRGIPRLINVLCDRMLLGAYSQDKARVDESICRQATVEVLGEEKAQKPVAKQSARRRWFHTGGWAAAAAMTAVVAWQQWPLLSSPVETAAANTEVASDPADDAQPAEAERLISAEAPPALTAETLFAQYSYTDSQQAMAELLAAAELTATDASQPCSAVDEFQCDSESLSTWNALRALNRPVVLRLVNPAKQEAFATLVGLSDKAATLRVGGALEQVPLAILGPLWTGDITYTWRKPASFTEAVSINAEGDIVDWIAARFAELDKQKEPLARGRFTRQLADRVKIFQRDNQLQADGIFGARTLMALNHALGLDKTLETNLQTDLPAAVQ